MEDPAGHGLAVHENFAGLKGQAVQTQPGPLGAFKVYPKPEQSGGVTHSAVAVEMLLIAKARDTAVIVKKFFFIFSSFNFNNMIVLIPKFKKSAPISVSIYFSGRTTRIARVSA